MSVTSYQDYQTYLQKLHGEEDENDEIEKKNIVAEVEDSGDIDNNATIIMDEDGNYYYKSSDKMVMVESISKVTETNVKKVSAVVTHEKKRKKAGQTTAFVSSKKTILPIRTAKKIKQEPIDEKNVDEKIKSEIDDKAVYEFDENEQDPDNPADAADLDYKCKGIIRSDKKTTGNEQSFTCMICSYQASKKFLLSRHMKTHSDERPYKCAVCERGFKTKTALGNHRNTHLGYKPHGCSSCDMAFTTSGELVRHVRYRHTHIKPHKCTECDYCSVEMSKLRRHMRCHTGERPYQCPECTYASPDTFKLKRHMRIHTGEKPYECDICHARFTQSNSLKHHRLIHSVNDKPVFQCHLCPTTCGRKTDLRLHITKLHSSDEPIPCKRCGKELPDRYSYKMHIKTHNGEKCYRCDYCPYASISRRHLESHVFIHLNAKPFVCGICQSSFRQKSLLTRHMKIYHSDNYERPKEHKKDHKCPHCDKMFAFNGNLIRHMEIHDPTSRLLEEKEQLKMGRMKRVKPDGTIVTVSASSNLSEIYDDNEEAFYEETEEQQQVDDETLEELEQQYEETEECNGKSIQYVYDDYEADECEAQYEEEQCEQQVDESDNRNQLIDVKQEKMEVMDIAQTAAKKIITIKAEGNNDSDLDVQDDQGYMVIEVLPDDDEDEDDDIDDNNYEVQQQEEDKAQPIQSQSVKHSIINEMDDVKDLPKKTQTFTSDYFGFEVEEYEDENDEETKGVIKLLELIEQE